LVSFTLERDRDLINFFHHANTFERYLSIAICAVICGVNSCEHIEVFGLSKLHWFKDFLQLPHDIPSHVTFGRVFAQIDPDKFQRPLRISASLFLLQFSIQHSIRINNASRLHSPLRFRPQAVLSTKE
jgi:hypothetical protein